MVVGGAAAVTITVSVELRVGDAMAVAPNDGVPVRADVRGAWGDLFGRDREVGAHGPVGVVAAHFDVVRCELADLVPNSRKKDTLQVNVDPQRRSARMRKTDAPGPRPSRAPLPPRSRGGAGPGSSRRTW